MIRLLIPCLLPVAALLAQTVVPLSLPGSSDSLVIHAYQHGDTLWQVELGAGRLVLDGEFDKWSSWPQGNWSTFEHVELSAGGVSGGVLEFRACALGPGADFWGLPLAPPDSVELRLVDCWLTGNASGARLEANGGRLTATDTWFTVLDTAVVAAGGEGSFDACAFCWSRMGASLQTGSLAFSDCSFHSLNTGVDARGGWLETVRCVMQSSKTMLRASGDASALLDTTHFYETGLFCVEGVGDTTGISLSLRGSWFDPQTAPPSKRLLNLPDEIARDTLDSPLLAPVEAEEVDVLVRPIRPGTDGTLELLVTMPLRATCGLPFRPRLMSIYAAEAAGLSPAALALGPARLDGAVVFHLPLDDLPTLAQLPEVDHVPVTVEVTTDSEGGLLATTVSGEFLFDEGAAPAAP